MSRRALIFGVGGQDGSYLADLLVEKGYEVHGTYRRSSIDNLTRVRHLDGRLCYHRADLTDPASILRVINTVRPIEIYNMADQDHVGWSADTPGYSIGVTVGGVSTILEIVRQFNRAVTRIFQPISATIFGDVPAETPQRLTTPLNPQSPYACAKAHAWHLCRHYREKYGVFVSCGVLYNHDSPRRGPDYLLQKIARGVMPDGDLSRVVDIGHAREFVLWFHALLQESKPRDVLIGTGRGYSIRSLVEHARCKSDTDWIKYRPTSIEPVHHKDRWLTPARNEGPSMVLAAPDVLRDISEEGRCESRDYYLRDQPRSQPPG